MSKHYKETLCTLVFIAGIYILGSWLRFTILQPTAGDGAFYVHFKEVITWEDVPELQGEDR
jgi:hypothetical protein